MIAWICHGCVWIVVLTLMLAALLGVPDGHAGLGAPAGNTIDVCASRG